MTDTTREHLRLAIPNKGRISEPIIELLEKGGLHINSSSSRTLIAPTCDPGVEVLFARPIDIPEYVANGAADLGITGRDMVQERRTSVTEILDMKMASKYNQNGHGNKMHELSITQNILNIALEEAEKANATRISKISLVVGQASGIVPESVQFCFDELKKGSIAGEASLDFTVVPTQLKCPKGLGDTVTS